MAEKKPYGVVVGEIRSVPVNKAAAGVYLFYVHRFRCRLQERIPAFHRERRTVVGRSGELLQHLE